MMGRPANAVRIHMEIEQLLDRHRNAGTPEPVVREALGRALRGSVALALASAKLDATKKHPVGSD